MRNFAKHALIGMALSTTLISGALSAQEADAHMMGSEQWLEIKTFLEHNPDVTDQLMHYMSTAPAANQEDLDKAYIAEHADQLLNNPLDGVLGNPDGAITIVKFSDFRCGYCRTASSDLAQLISENDQVRVVVKELPILGKDSEYAAAFALAVKKVGGDAAYQDVKTHFFAEGLDMTPMALNLLVDQLDLDPVAVFEAMESDEIAAHIAATAAMAKDMKINGTPALIFNDIVVRGGLPVEAMRQAVRELY